MYFKILNILACLLITTAATAKDAVDIEYDEQKDILTLNVQDAAIGTTLQQLSDVVEFELTLDDGDIHRKISISMTGASAEVIKQLVKNSNVILSQTKTLPQKVTKIIFLPTGTDQSAYLPKESNPHPVATDDPEKYKNHMKRYQKKLNQQPKDKSNSKSYDRSKLIYTKKTLNNKQNIK